MKFRRSLKILLSKPRIWKYRFLRGNIIGKGTWVATNTFLRKCDIGNNVYIGANCVINYAHIGNYCSIAPAVQIGGMEHAYNKLTTCAHLSDEQTYGLKTIIEDDVWIGAACIIKQGIHIGRGAVIGANSFVNSDVPPYSVFFGTPARFHKMRFSQKIIDQLEESKYWEKDIYHAKKLLSIIQYE